MKTIAERIEDLLSPNQIETDVVKLEKLAGEIITEESQDRRPWGGVSWQLAPVLVFVSLYGVALFWAFILSSRQVFGPEARFAIIFIGAWGFIAVGVPAFLFFSASMKRRKYHRLDEQISKIEEVITKRLKNHSHESGI